MSSVSAVTDLMFKPFLLIVVFVCLESFSARGFRKEKPNVFHK